MRKSLVVLSFLMVASMLLSACGTPKTALHASGDCCSGDRSSGDRSSGNCSPGCRRFPDP